MNKIRCMTFTRSHNGCCDRVHDDVNFWLSCNQDDVKVIDIKYSISEKYASICVVYEDVRNYEED